MQISNVAEILDNGKFVTIITQTGTTIRLPYAKHNLIIEDNGNSIDIIIEFNTG